MYRDICDLVTGDDVDGSKIGKGYVLPRLCTSCFIMGPHYQNYLDAIAVCLHIGHLYLFLIVHDMQSFVG